MMKIAFFRKLRRYSRIQMSSRASALLVSMAVLLIALGACGEITQTDESIDQSTANYTEEEASSAEVIPEGFSISSAAFQNESEIPALYTCDGDELSPPLQWSQVPAGTASFVLILEDPDAPGGTWVHWVVYNLPGEIQNLPPGIATDPGLPDGAVVGENSWGEPAYGGPCPPSGTHRYFFNLYAIDQRLALDPGASSGTVQAAIEGHVLGRAELIGTYSR